MLLSHSKKFIFIHNHKAAGTSITKALKKYCNPSFNESPRLDKFLLKTGIYSKVYMNDFDVHITARKLMENIPSRLFSDYFKFGFVRNPWDWQVSLYTYMLKDKNHYQHNIVKSMTNFDEYIAWRIHKDLYFQKDFFYDSENNCLMDFIGRFENLDHDFMEVCKRINVNVPLPHLNKSRENAEYLSYYSENSLQMITEAYKADIELLGYSLPVFSK